MAQYLDNTIYTNYALSKICQNLVDDIENFEFVRVKVGSGDNTLDANRKDLSALLYSLNILEMSYKDGIITIKCELPPELADVPITEIGLFDTIMGFDHLFSYSKVNVVKPSDLGYELTIVLNLGPKTVDFPGITEFHVNQHEYATKDMLESFTSMFLYVDTNLERIIRSNAEVIGYNIPEKVYEKEREISTNLKNISYSLLSYSLQTRLKNQIKDLFFFGNPNYLAYELINYVDSESYLDSKYKLWSANRDNITFNNGPTTFSVLAQLDDLSTPSTIVNKKNDMDLYFSLDVEQREEGFMIANDKITGENVPVKALYNELVFTIYGYAGSYKIRYIFDEDNIGKYLGRPVLYTISFNGDIVENPVLHFYIDEEEPEEYIPSNIVEPSIEEQAAINDSDSEETRLSKIEKTTNKLKARLYNKVIYEGDISELIELPDNSYIPIKNYNVNYNNNEKTDYHNSLGIKSIVSLKKQVDKYELALLVNSLNRID